jgi:hypothetical protein
MNRYIVIHYAEIALKGKNRAFCELVASGLAAARIERANSE